MSYSAELCLAKSYAPCLSIILSCLLSTGILSPYTGNSSKFSITKAAPLPGTKPESRRGLKIHNF